MSVSTYDVEFTRKCVELAMLSATQADALLAGDSLPRTDDLPAAQDASIAQRALRMGVLSVSDVDIVESLMRPTETAPGYEILDLVGRGGMGVVYRARQVDLDRIVALKTLLVSQLSNEHAAMRFEREARAVARLRHPNIVQAISYGHHNGRHFFVMEFVVGRTCDQMLRDGIPLSPRLTWNFVRQTAAGLLHAQRQQVIHRDIKPSNLIAVTPPEGSPLPDGIDMIKIADFGLATLDELDKNVAKLTTGNALMGSPAYMSPEQFTGETVDYRSDIYALGATALHLLTAQCPFPSRSIAQVATLKSTPLSINHPVLANLESAQATLLIRMLAPDANDRPQSYEELFNLIDGLAIAEGDSASEPHASSASTWSPAIRDSIRVTGDDTPTIELTTTLVAMQPTLVARRPFSKLVSRYALVACVLVVCGWAIFSLLESPTRGPRPFTRASTTEPLFDGITLQGWDVGGTMIGAWNVVRAPDGSSAIACLDERGAITRQLPEWEHHRTSIFVWLTSPKSIADIDFEIPGNDAQGRRPALRISTQTLQFGYKQSDFAPVSVVRSVPAIDSLSKRYHVVAIERQESDWYVFFEEQFVGSIPINSEAEGGSLRIVVDGNDTETPSVYFADVHASELTRTQAE